MPQLRVASVLSALLLGTAVGLTGCSSDEETTEVDRDEAIGVQVEAPRVTLLDAGAAPQETLRYSDIDANQDVRTTLAEDFQQHAGTEAEVPAASTVDTDDDFQTTLKATTEAAEDSETGSNRAVRITMDDMEAFGSLTSAEQSHLESAAGFGFGWYANERGVISSVNFAAPAAATDEGRSMVEDYIFKLLSLPVIFPEEAVGEGAQWTVESRVLGEDSLLQTTTYELRERDGDVVTLGVTVEQRPSQGSFSYDDTNLDVLDTENTTQEGELTVNLGDPLPTGGTVAWQTRVLYGQPDDETGTVIAQDTATSLSYE